MFVYMCLFCVCETESGGWGGVVCVYVCITDLDYNTCKFLFKCVNQIRL